jgi:hypothetical protein
MIIDYRLMAVSQNSVFLQQVAKLETRILDRIFGHNLLSSRSIIVSICCSILPVAIAYCLDDSVGQRDRQRFRTASACVSGIEINRPISRVKPLSPPTGKSAPPSDDNTIS